MLFILRDAGETLGLFPLIEELSNCVGIRCCVLAWDTALAVLRSRFPHAATRVHLASLDVFGLEEPSRLEELPWEDVDSIARCFDVRCVVTGMVTALQRQLATRFKRGGARSGRRRRRSVPVVGFCDGYGRWGPASIMGTFVSGECAIDTLWVTCRYTAECAVDAMGAGAASVRVAVVGSPTLRSWQLTPVDDSWLVCAAADADPAAPRVLFVGGYGGDYDVAVRMVGGAALRLRGEMSFFLSPHPHTSTSRDADTGTGGPGALEAGILTAAALPLMTLVPPHVTTPVAARSCSVVVSHCSTAGVQALFVNKPSVYCVSARGEYEDVGTHAGLIPVVCTVDELVATLRDLRASGFAVDQRRLEHQAVPVDCVHTMTSHVEMLLKS